MRDVRDANAGMSPIAQIMGAGITANIPLLFSVDVYEQVALAYIRGLEKCADPSHVASVASFFVSRIDTAIEGYIKGDPSLAPLSGRVAIANAKLAYQRYLAIFSGPEWEALEAKGAMTQRVLWASTSTKSPKLRDVLYVEELIGPDTVNTIPPATYDAFKDHGEPRASLESGIDEAKAVMASLAEAGISIQDVTPELLEQGVKLFADAFLKLLAAVHAA